jgi:hypothetical protein
MLKDIVRSIQEVADLPRLFAELGYLEDHGPPPGPNGVGVARWKGFRVIGVAADAPRDVARAMATRLGGAACPALVAALGDGLLALAAPRVGSPGCTPVLAISTARPDPFALELLAALAPRAGSSALEHALRVADVLATEEVGTRFFTAFRAILERMAASLGPRGIPADRKLAALLTLTRVLFLYFVQARGWLDRRSDFLPTLLDEALARRRPFHRSVLHPLFFGTLNRPTAERTHGTRFGTIPYLNGGLFEPHPVERRLGPVAFSNPLWRDAFDGLFQRFRFCVRESGEANAVAPDMLGRAFERVMDTGERQTTGTFYTPEPLVRQLVSAALATALTGRAGLSHDDALALLAGSPPPVAKRTAAARTLARLRILDPAVGSGAFLLGALETLTRAHLVLAGHAAGRTPGGIRRQIIRANLFGVDLSPIAVHLAELRLWLAVIADDPTDDLAQVTPLPNLHAVVRQGDSLLDPLGAARALGVGPIRPVALRAARAARTALYEARGAARAPATTALRDVELRAAAALVEAAGRRVGAALRDLLTSARGRDLFGHRVGLAASQRRRHDALRRERRALAATARCIADGSVPFFAFEIHCPDVMAAGGFDVVVGNPPWVRAERLPDGMRTALHDRFSWWRAGSETGFKHLPDLAVAFLERAVELAAPGGAVGLLLPSKLASAGYAERARAGLVRETSLAYVHRVPDRDAAAFGAVVYPLAVVTQKAEPTAGTRVALDFARTRTLPQDALAGPGPWILLPRAARAALERLRRAGPLLGSCAPPALGVKTGADEVLVGTVHEERGVALVVRFREREVELERRVLRPVLRGRDIMPFAARTSRVVVWPYAPDGTLCRELPPLTLQYVRGLRARLEARADYRGDCYWTLFRVNPSLGRWRVVWPDIARAPTAVALDEVASDAIPLNSCYVAVADRQTVLATAGMLNTTWAHVLLRAGADEARGGDPRYNARVTPAHPQPQAGSSRAALAALSRRAHHHRDVSQHDLDRAAADALGLPAAVRATLRSLADDLG